MSPAVLARAAASAALDALLLTLQEAGIPASRDAGSFHVAPLGVLVGLPSLAGSTLAARTFEVPVYVVSSDPLSSPAYVDALYSLADDVALVLRCEAYRPMDWRSHINAEPLPAVELTAICTVPLTEVSDHGIESDD